MKKVIVYSKNKILNINNDIEKNKEIIKNNKDNKTKILINKRLLNTSIENNEKLKDKKLKLENLILEKKNLLINLNKNLVEEEKIIKKEKDSYFLLLDVNNKFYKEY